MPESLQDRRDAAARALITPLVAAAVGDGRIEASKAPAWVDYLATQRGPAQTNAVQAFGALPKGAVRASTPMPARSEVQRQATADAADLERLAGLTGTPQMQQALRSMAAESTASAAAVMASRPPSAPIAAGARRVFASAFEQTGSLAYQAAASSGVPQPTPFSQGDLPSMTASGVDPKVIGSLPWQARWAAAEAPTIAGVYAMVQKYSGPDGATMAEIDAGRGLLGDEPALYAKSYSWWVSAAGTPAYGSNEVAR